jgi:predicted amidophosphoribosyltransferase
MIPCPDCGREVSRSAVACPGCGRPIAPSQHTIPTIRRGLDKFALYFLLPLAILFAISLIVWT